MSAPTRYAHFGALALLPVVTWDGERFRGLFAHGLD